MSFLSIGSVHVYEYSLGTVLSARDKAGRSASVNVDKVTSFLYDRIVMAEVEGRSPVDVLLAVNRVR